MRTPLIALAMTLAACGAPAPTVSYRHSAEDFTNPERGFFGQVDLLAGGDFSAVRTAGYTLAYAGVRLDEYRAAPLPATLLDALTAGFADVRAAGIKVILRFVYNDALGQPDASKARILAHLAQLQPILHANADVIVVMEAGFIGAWGEWHRSTNGLDNPRDRKEILDAILAALPASRSTLVRRPIFKRDAYGGPLAARDAFDQSPAARVGHQNGCFLASATDFGTYVRADIAGWKAFIAQEGRFTPVGGETCALNEPRTDCATALAELAELHWSFLNALYHPDVLARWDEQGCRAEIARRLGYRIELRSADFEDRVAPGGVLHLTVRLENTGHAAMFNARPLFVTLARGSQSWAAATTIDPRRWEPGEPVTLQLTLRVPVDATAGAHQIGLWLPDADPRLREPAVAAWYAVRLANAPWRAPINVLTNDLMIDPDAPAGRDESATDFEQLQ